MFEYAIKPSVEDMVVATGNSNDNSSTGSAETITLINTGIIRGLVSAFAMRLAAKGVKQEEITEKISAFINQCFYAGDLDKYAIGWLKNEDWYRRAERAGCICAPCGDEDSLWTYAYDISEHALCERTYASQWGKDYREKLPANERAILDNYEKASEAYYEASRIRDEYFRNKSRVCIKAIIVKYGESLSKLDTELYEFLCERYEISTPAEPVAVKQEEVSADAQTDPLKQ